MANRGTVGLVQPTAPPLPGPSSYTGSIIAHASWNAVSLLTLSFVSGGGGGGTTTPTVPTTGQIWPRGVRT